MLVRLENAILFLVCSTVVDCRRQSARGDFSAWPARTPSAPSADCRGTVCLHHDFLNLIERHLVAPPIVELRGARAFVRGHLLGVFEEPPVLEIDGVAQQVLCELGVQGKYHVAFVLSGQFLAQIRPSVRAAVIGNIGALVAFQLGHDDADELAPVFDPYGVEALTWLDRGQVAVRISTGGNVAVPFKGVTFPEIGGRFDDQRRAVLEQSRRRYGTPRRVVEARLQRWAGGR